MASCRAESDELSEPLTPPELPGELPPDDPESDSELPAEGLLPESEGSAPAPPDVGPPPELSCVSGPLNPGLSHP